VRPAAGEQRILGTQLLGVEPDQLVADEPADDQLVVQLRAKPLGLLDTREGRATYSSTLTPALS